MRRLHQRLALLEIGGAGLPSRSHLVQDQVGKRSLAKTRIDRFRRETARRLRREETSAEARLWQAIDRVPLLGTHFRRQAPIGPYVADFACLKHKLIVEVDGPSHTTEAGRQRDAARTRWLEAQGYRVLRFWNADVYNDLDAVLDTIFAALPPDP